MQPARARGLRSLINLRITPCFSELWAGDAGCVCAWFDSLFTLVTLSFNLIRDFVGARGQSASRCIKMRMFETTAENNARYFSYHKVFWQDPSHQTSFCCLSYLFRDHHDLLTENRIELPPIPKISRECCLAGKICGASKWLNFPFRHIFWDLLK